MPKTAPLDENLTPRQTVAISELLAQGSIAQAAEKAGINERTLFRWLREATFRQAYLEARREAVSQATARLQRACTQAVETLEAVMSDSEAPASSRVSAAKTVLEMAVKGIELEDLESRIAALEVAGKEGGTR